MDDYSFEKVKKRKSRNIIDKILVFIIFILLIVFSFRQERFQNVTFVSKSLLAFDVLDG